MHWDLFCRVIDNWGDVGVCWRLARDLASRGEQVRLWIDDDQALAWMAPRGAPGVSVGRFDDAASPGDVVVEAFGCNPPEHFVATMAAQGTGAPVWINLEYLSAESYVERSHGLPSPQRNGLTKWFFYPGFTPRTGGLLRETGLLEERAAFDGDAWLARRGWARQPGERVVTLFCYANPALPAMLQALADAPTLLLLAPGAAQEQVHAAPAGLRCVKLPWLTQAEFDRLLWSADLNFVRGEDSLVRAQWAGAPWVWQAYPQDDGAHGRKVQALLERLPAVPGLAAVWAAWNGLQPAWPAWPDFAAWRTGMRDWRSTLASQADLTSGLQAFVHSRSRRPC